MERDMPRSGASFQPGERWFVRGKRAARGIELVRPALHPGPGRPPAANDCPVASQSNARAGLPAAPCPGPVAP